MTRCSFAGKICIEMGEYFHDPGFDQTEAAMMPVNYWPASPERMVPGEIYYPYPYQFVMDQDALLYVKSAASFDGDAAAPDFFGSRIGLMQAQELVGEGAARRLVSGYIADIRATKGGDIRQIFLDKDEADTKVFGEELTLMYGIVYNDSEGRVCYTGKELKGSAEFLADETDKVRLKKSGVATAPVHATESLADSKTVEYGSEAHDPEPVWPPAELASATSPSRDLVGAEDADFDDQRSQENNGLLLLKEKVFRGLGYLGIGRYATKE